MLPISVINELSLLRGIASQYIFKTKYPIFTYIEYFNKGPVLSVCSGSHRTVPFLFQRAQTIYNNNSQIGILFNCDLIHAGALNNLGNKRHAVQYKIVPLPIHKDLSKQQEVIVILSRLRLFLFKHIK